MAGRLTPLEEAVASCRAVLAAAEKCLTDAGCALPANRYVSIQGGDWLVGKCDDCCSQLVVTPFTQVARFSDPFGSFTGGFADTRRAWQRIVNYDIVHSTAVNVQVQAGKLGIGEVAKPWDGAVNQNTHWAETIPIVAARWALVRGLPVEIPKALCAVGIECRIAFLGSADPWVEGGCAGTKLTVQVQQ